MIEIKQKQNMQSGSSLPVELEPARAIDTEITTQSAQIDADETLYLIGRPTLKQFHRFVRHHAVNPESEGDLTEEWNTASDYILSLEKEEAGLADDHVITRLGPEYEPLLIEFLKDPLIQGGFNTVPTEVALIDLNRLVVYQKHIDLTYIRQLRKRLSSAPSREEIFRTCLPYDHPQAPVKWLKQGDKYIFMSPSNDLRFLGTMPLRPNNIVDYLPPGDLVSAIGLALGFGSNFLNAAYFNKRLILQNGSHRAYALREIGVTHVPCIIEHVSSEEELGVVMSSEVRDNPDLYLRHPRPPMLRDYFNPRLRKVMSVHRQLRQITVKFKVEEGFVPMM
ncbi:MAG: hypothetical protein J2P31_04445 [Blastocatellia bacterium]|nr:hypothetical protein [Blastocatellia bacterium]